MHNASTHSAHSHVFVQLALLELTAQQSSPIHASTIPVMALVLKSVLLTTVDLVMNVNVK